MFSRGLVDVAIFVNHLNSATYQLLVEAKLKFNRFEQLKNDAVIGPEGKSKQDTFPKRIKKKETHR